MGTKRRWTLVCLGAASVLVAATVTAPPAWGDQPTSTVAQSYLNQGYQQTFSDEFNYLDTTTWTRGFRAKTSQFIHPGDTMFGYTESQVATTGGALRITAQNTPLTVAERTVGNRSGAVSSRYGRTFTYGYFETRLRKNATVAGWTFVPAFWMDGIGDSDNRSHTSSSTLGKKALPNGTASEVDIIEAPGDASNWAVHRVDADGTGPASVVSNRAALTVGQWYTVGMAWTPSGYTFYLDGATIGSVTSGTISNTPMYLMLSAAGGGVPASGSASVDFDYVRVYQSPAIAAANPAVAWTGFDRGAWKATAISTSGNRHPANVVKVHTGVPQPFWRTAETSQSGDEWFQVDLGTMQTLNQLRIVAPQAYSSTLDTVGAPPAQYQLYMTNDVAGWRQPGSSVWGSAFASGAGANTINACFAQRTGRYLMIKQVGTNATKAWSIRDLYGFNSTHQPLTGVVC